MAYTHISGKNFAIFISGLMVTVDKATLKITDNLEVQKTNGVPDGYTEGDVDADGELTMSYKYFIAMIALARAAGSWRAMPGFDLDFIGATTSNVFPVAAYECKFKLESIVDADKNGKDKGVVTLPFNVTGKDFVKIGGVPYLDALETIGIVA